VEHFMVIPTEQNESNPPSTMYFYYIITCSYYTPTLHTGPLTATSYDYNTKPGLVFVYETAACGNFNRYYSFFETR